MLKISKFVFQNVTLTVLVWLWIALFTGFITQSRDKSHTTRQVVLCIFDLALYILKTQSQLPYRQTNIKLNSFSNSSCWELASFLGAPWVAKKLEERYSRLLLLVERALNKPQACISDFGIQRFADVSPCLLLSCRVLGWVKILPSPTALFLEKGLK